MANLSSSNCPRCELNKLQFQEDLATEQSNTLLNVAVYMPTDMAGVGIDGIARGANTSMVAHNIIFKFVNVDRISLESPTAPLHRRVACINQSHGRFETYNAPPHQP